MIPERRGAGAALQLDLLGLSIGGGAGAVLKLNQGTGILFQLDPLGLSSTDSLVLDIFIRFLLLFWVMLFLCCNEKFPR